MLSRLRAGIVLFLLMLTVGMIYAAANPHPEGHFDYQFRMATALLSGKLGIDEPVSWLSELIPFEGRYHSVFPLGSVLSMMPVAILQKIRGSTEFPVRIVVAMIGGMLALFALILTLRYRDRTPRRILLLLFVLFGTWAGANTVYGGARQLALAVAMVGQFAALAFTLVARQPFLAGLCFAIAFGNRTQLILLAPLYVFLLLRYDPYRDLPSEPKNLLVRLQTQWQTILPFFICPLILGVATLLYNYARFHSPLDFGYARIPGILNEPWYRHGIFSLYAIPINLQTMVWTSAWQVSDSWPYIKPNPFGGSILSACPFLFLAFRQGGRDRVLRRVCWTAIGIATFVLWIHGSTGEWQFGYRHAMDFLPWVFVLLLDQRGGKVRPVEWILGGLSVLATVWATYLFYWTDAVY